MEAMTEFRCEVCGCTIRFRDPQPIGMNAVRCSRCRGANPDPKRARANWLRRQRHAVMVDLGLKRVRGALGGVYYE